MKLSRPIPFRWGRTDCVPEDDKKWTPYSFEATKDERHSNAYETGTKAVQDFKRDFNMTARETISLMAIHGLAEFNKNFEESTFYKWIGGLKREGQEGTFSNLYYKYLNGKTYWRGHSERFGKHLFLGDEKGNPVGGNAFKIQCTKAWNDSERFYGGPCHFRPTHPGKKHS